VPSPDAIARNFGTAQAAPVGASPCGRPLGPPYSPRPKRSDRRSKDVPISVLLLVMELLPAFLALIASSVLDAAGLPYSVFWFLFVSGLCGILIASLLTAISLTPPWSRFVFSAGAVVVAASMAQLPAHDWLGISVTALLVAAAYWRGVVIGSQSPTHENAECRTGFGFALVFLGLILVIGRGSSVHHSVWPMLALSGIAFALSSMWALALIKADWTRPAGAATGLLVAVGIPLGLLLLLSVGMLELLSLNVTGWLFNLAAQVGHLTQPLRSGVLAVLTAAFDANARLVGVLLQFVRAHEHAVHWVPPKPSLGHRPRHVPVPSGGAGWVGIALAAGLAVLVLAVMAYLIRRALSHRRIRGAPRAKSSERVRHVWSRSRFWRGLGAWLRELVGRGTELAARTLRATGRRISGVDHPSDPVRRVYSQLLRRATAAGLLRAIATTPEEFLDQLESRWPEGSEHFAALTRAYILRRYGDVPFAADQLAELDRHWQRARIVVRPPSRSS